MTNIWRVEQDGKVLGTVEAVSRKGACHAAYEQFGIAHDKRSSITVEKIAHTGGFVSEPPPTTFGDVACSFNPALANRRVIAFDPAGPGRDSCVEITVENGQIKDVRTLGRDPT